ncbi:DNA mismatch repair protein MutL [Thermohalobacter berrensis]|uniref:DNA mismatch repair protein MutL n=1 Tax=Thermohalobacter berrensis TaxID=99594 RepID=A0A419TBA7_9FIRM|nr:DNA mismatch repair protein MutL [Thermohalobacter berrensis]
MNKIKLLDEETINKISAGEVVERPASVVKELVENSIDAGSTSITVEIKKGGKKYIRVTDNGIGIEKNDINIAFLRHSTSKINKAEDLDNITSLGFRGEALSSISAVSQLQLITKTTNSVVGNQVMVMGGKIVENKEVGCPQGTTIIVKNLFYNTPARKKFLKSDSVESSYISDIVNKLALGNPNISFKFIKNNKLIMKTPGNNNRISTIYSIFGKEFANSLFKLDYIGENLKIQGFISKPSYTRGNRNHQYFYINGRIVKSDFLTKTIEKIYKPLIPNNRFPAIILYIDIPPREIDVNVHPTKIEIRFKNKKTLDNVLTSIVEELINKENLIPEVDIDNKSKDNGSQEEQINFVDSLEEVPKNIEEAPKDDELEVDYIELDQENKNIQILDYTTSFKNKKSGNYSMFKEKNRNISNSNLFKEKSSSFKLSKNNKTNTKIPKLDIIGRLFNTYILAEEKNNDLFYIIDQHAAHERIMYEKLKKDLENESVMVQKLLAPEIIHLTNSEVEVVLENIEMFKSLGFEIEEFGVNSIALRGVPTILGKPNSKKLFLELLDKIQENIKYNYELKIDKVMKMACTSAVKAGDFIDEIEIDRLIQDLKQCENPYTCPHGRPIIIKMSKYELERKFKRIQ